MLGCTKYKKDGNGDGRLMSPKYYYEYMGIKDTEPAAPIIVPKGRDIKPKNQGISRDLENTPKTERVVIGKANIPGILYRDMDLNSVLQMILQCLSDISINRFYSSNVLIDLLRGVEPLSVKDVTLMHVEGFRKLQHIPSEDLEFIVDWLIEKKYILETKERYPVLHPTYNGVHYSETMKKSLLMDLKKRLEETEQHQ
jgi:DNA helicase-4